MTLKLEDKKAIVAEVAEVAKQALSVVAADYRGLTVPDMTELRSKARQQKIYLRVVRNTLATLALKGTNFECLNEALKGPVLLAFSIDEPGASARLLRDFAKTREKLTVKALSIGGQLLEAQQLDRVAKLPTRHEAIELFARVLQAPITKFARTLNEVPSKFVRVLAAVREQKQ